MTISTIDRVHEHYSIDNWGDGYFAVNEAGEVVVRPNPDNPEVAIRLVELVENAQSAGLTLPTLFRFTDILKHRVNQLCRAFTTTMEALEYDAKYLAVYPIKVNQQSLVVDSIISAPVESEHAEVGLEAGSKPELLAVLAQSRTIGGTIVCNGYKDREYVRLALIGEKMHRRVYIVIEKLSELRLVLEEANMLKVEPRLGIRVRLSTIGAGNWQNSGGQKAKFGLSSLQLIRAVEELKKYKKLHTLQLLHFHMGSQIPNVRDIQKCMREAVRHLVELSSMGVNITTLDVGGGLGIDYDGTRSRSECSVNYNIQEYAYNILKTTKDACEQADIRLPDIITESGRALTAHHAVLISNIIDVEEIRTGDAEPPDEGAHPLLRDMWLTYNDLVIDNGRFSLSEVYHEIGFMLEEAQAMYIHSVLTLEQKAYAEYLYVSSCRLLQHRLNMNNRIHREIMDELNEKLANKVFLNFSLFQSIPDAWGIGQVFPVLPIDQLDRPLTRKSVIQDITCDSDGRINHYVDNGRVERILSLPDFASGKWPHMAIFLVGAYQEILGDMHNLFGDTDSVDVELTKDGSFKFAHYLKGDTVDDLLKYVNYDVQELLNNVQNNLADSNMTVKEQAVLLREIQHGLTGYTYLED